MRPQFSTADILLLPSLILLSIGVNGLSNFLTEDIRFECTLTYGMDFLGLDKFLPLSFCDQMIDVADRPVDYGIAIVLALSLLPFTRVPRFAGLVLLITVPFCCFYPIGSPRIADRWLEIPFALLITCAYVYCMRWRYAVVNRWATRSVVVLYALIGLVGWATIQDKQIGSNGIDLTFPRRSGVILDAKIFAFTDRFGTNIEPDIASIDGWGLDLADDPLSRIVPTFLIQRSTEIRLQTTCKSDRDA